MTAYDQLRDEVNAFQMSRAELFKWKFVLVGSAMAAGLGFSERVPMGSAWVLILTPGLALYCDLLILDYDSRIAVIAAFLRGARDSAVHAAYEEYIVQREFASAWIFGRMALWLSTAAVCSVVVLYGVYLRIVTNVAGSRPEAVTVVENWWMLVIAGLVWLGCLVTTLAFWKSHHDRIRFAEPSVVVLEHLRRAALHERQA